MEVTLQFQPNLSCINTLPLHNLMTKYVCFLILGDKYVNGEIIPCKYPTFQPKRSGGSKSEGRRYERRRDGPISAGRQKPRQEAAASDSSST
jgi:hypothetical protein